MTATEVNGIHAGRHFASNIEVGQRVCTGDYTTQAQPDMLHPRAQGAWFEHRLHWGCTGRLQRLCRGNAGAVCCSGVPSVDTAVVPHVIRHVLGGILVGGRHQGAGAPPLCSAERPQRCHAQECASKLGGQATVPESPDLQTGCLFCWLIQSSRQHCETIQGPQHG